MKTLLRKFGVYLVLLLALVAGVWAIQHNSLVERKKAIDNAVQKANVEWQLKLQNERAQNEIRLNSLQKKSQLDTIRLQTKIANLMAEQAERKRQFDLATKGLEDPFVGPRMQKFFNETRERRPND